MTIFLLQHPSTELMRRALSARPHLLKREQLSVTSAPESLSCAALLQLLAGL
jgi:hypothetical protein